MKSQLVFTLILIRLLNEIRRILFYFNVFSVYAESFLRLKQTNRATLYQLRTKEKISV